MSTHLSIRDFDRYMASGQDKIDAEKVRARQAREREEHRQGCIAAMTRGLVRCGEDEVTANMLAQCAHFQVDPGI